MTISQSVRQYMANRGVSYDLLTHRPTLHSLATAHASHISEEKLAKGILVRYRDGYLLAIVPASRKVHLPQLGEWLDQPIGLAS